jgi:peptidoglycan/LPS O-acetylase OafA/YrhL
VIPRLRVVARGVRPHRERPSDPVGLESPLYPRGGYIGVDIFFVLSGFLITTILLAEWDKRRAISLRGFSARRALRLLPALAGVALVTGTVAAILPNDPLAATALTAHLVTQPFRWLRALLKWRPALWVGRRSYGLYLWHNAIFWMLTPLLRLKNRFSQVEAQDVLAHSPQLQPLS